MKIGQRVVWEGDNTIGTIISIGVTKFLVRSDDGRLLSRYLDEFHTVYAETEAMEGGRGMTNAFSVRNRKRCESPQGFNHPLNLWSGSDWMVAVVGEIGEAANNLKKLNRVRDGIRRNTEDESPHCYKRLSNVLAAHTGSIMIKHILYPLGAAMAGSNEFDPYKD